MWILPISGISLGWCEVIVIAGVLVLVLALIATALYVALNIYVFYLVEGVGKVLEIIEEPNLEGVD